MILANNVNGGTRWIVIDEEHVWGVFRADGKEADGRATHKSIAKEYRRMLQHDPASELGLVIDKVSGVSKIIGGDL